MYLQHELRPLSREKRIWRLPYRCFPPVNEAEFYAFAEYLDGNRAIGPTVMMGLLRMMLRMMNEEEYGELEGFTFTVIQ